MPGPGDSDRINLIMAGGGVRFPAYMGALAAFEEMGVEILSVAGASAGSIVGSFLAAGWSVEDMHRKALATHFTAFKDFSLRAFLFEGGIYMGDRFERWVDTELAGARFKDLPRDLYVAAADLIGRTPFFFSRQTTPDVPVSMAVRCSMSIPWVWRPQRWDQRLLVDGQLMSWVRDGIDLMQGPDPIDPIRTVMLRMASSASEPLPDKKRLWPWDFAKILLDTMLNALDNQRVPGALWQDTILIQVEGIPTLKLDLSVAEKERLFRAGYDQARRYFRKGAPTSQPT